VRNIKDGSGLPYTILVSSWSLMTAELYLQLREAGMDQFSVSLDFPDERHDDFRCYPGLYRQLEDLIPRLARLGYDDIVLNSCITSENLQEIDAIADKAREWGVNLCYSAYSARRTGCRDLLPASPEQLAAINRQLDRWRSAATTPTGSSTAEVRWMPRAATSKTRGCPVARRATASWW
jgi:MoaA/NifB/PqqE/SkfB family radical SAM enzyme